LGFKRELRKFPQGGGIRLVSADRGVDLSEWTSERSYSRGERCVGTLGAVSRWVYNNDCISLEKKKSHQPGKRKVKYKVAISPDVQSEGRRHEGL